MLKVSKDCVVRISYELKFSNGQVLESSKASGPIDYVHGETRLLPVFQKRIEGMQVGEERRGVIPASEVFDEATFPTETMKRSSFPSDAKLEPGAMFEAKRPSGEKVQLKVLSVQGDQVNLRVMPDLSGKDLEFWVKVLVIDDPHAKKRESVAPPPPPADAVAVDVEPEPEEEKK